MNLPGIWAICDPSNNLVASDNHNGFMASVESKEMKSEKHINSFW